MPIIRLQKYNKIIPFEPVLHWRELVKRRRAAAVAFLRNCIALWMNAELVWLQQCFSHWGRVCEGQREREHRMIDYWHCVSDDEIYIVNRIFDNIARCNVQRRYSI